VWDNTAVENTKHTDSRAEKLLLLFVCHLSEEEVQYPPVSGSQEELLFHRVIEFSRSTCKKFLKLIQWKLLLIIKLDAPEWRWKMQKDAYFNLNNLTATTYCCAWESLNCIRPRKSAQHKSLPDKSSCRLAESNSSAVNRLFLSEWCDMEHRLAAPGVGLRVQTFPAI